MWRTAWQKAVKRAEAVVGYPAPFFNMRYLLSDELSNVAGHMQRLVHTKHPLYQTVRDMIGNRKSMAQTRGLLVLLMAQSVSSLSAGSSARLHGCIGPGQRSLAEIAEMVHSSMSIHRGVVNLDGYTPDTPERQDMEFGNKMAILCGDFLMAAVSMALADLQNTHIVSNVSEGMGDMVEAEFSLLASTPLSSDPLEPPPLTRAHWEEYVHLSSGSVLGRCASSALLLAGMSQELQTAVEAFSRDWARLYQLTEEMRSLKTNTWVWDIPGLPHILARGGDWRVPSQEAMEEYAQSARASLLTLPCDSEATLVLGQMVTAICKGV